MEDNKKETIPEVVKAPEVSKQAEPKIPEAVKTPDKMSILLAEIEELKKKDAEKDKKLEMLYQVADKGRVFNYENSRTEKKPFKVKLSIFKDGIIIGWRTVKDELVKHPTTGLTVGETQEYELLVLNKDNKIEKFSVNGYPAFSNARYSERIEAEITSKSESFEGSMTYDVCLPDKRVIKLDGRFLN